MVSTIKCRDHEKWFDYAHKKRMFLKRIKTVLNKKEGNALETDTPSHTDSHPKYSRNKLLKRFFLQAIIRSFAALS